MTWVEVFVVLVVSHLVGDFLLQTEWQAKNKYGGLGRDPVRRRALLTHVAWYTASFIPAAFWLGHQQGTGRAVIVVAIVGGTHLVQDDARLLVTYIRTVKHTRPDFGTPLWVAVDQTLHVLVLFGAALLATA
jgi:hypothetical protein